VSRACRAIAIGLGAGLLAGLGGLAAAQLPAPRLPTGLERYVSLDELLLETLRVESRLQAWILPKVYIDGQAYWIAFSETSPTAISPSFKDGKPGQCSRRAR
jgi:hypothetical protein